MFPAGSCRRFWPGRRASGGAKPFVETVDGASLTFAQAHEEALRVASLFAGLGHGAGGRIIVMLPNGLDFVRAWLGLGRLGAVCVVLNTGLSGAFLAHQIRSSGATTALVDAAFLPVIAAVADACPALRHVVVPGTDGASSSLPWAVSDFGDWRACKPYAGPTPTSPDTACILYTSGTTGPAKGVLMPHAHCFLFGLGVVDNVGLTPDDRYYVTLPLFHANGLLMQVYGCLIAGATAILRDRFSASAWLDDVRRHEATMTNVLGVMAQFVVDRPATPFDRDHALRGMMIAPYVPEQDAVLRERFGIRAVYSGFGMTEVNIPLYGDVKSGPPGCAGRVYERYFEVEIRDPDTDAPVPPGEVGEIMVRPKVGFGFMAGYDGLPEKTCEAWRNLWFHTGDAGTMDASGLVCFIDRIKDCIRRRGENISSAEVETAMLTLAGVSEAAAFAVPAGVAGGEDEVMIALVLEPGASVTVEAAVAHADRSLPRFARPRFVEILGELPKTQTGKIQKAELRRRGATGTAWDRQAASQDVGLGT